MHASHSLKRKQRNLEKMDDDEITKHNEIKEKISNRKNEVKDAVTTEALQLEEVMKDIWDPENNPVITERKKLCQIEQELKTRKNTLFEVLEKQQPTLVFSTTFEVDFPEISGLVSLNDDILVMFNSTSRTFVFFTIAGNKFVLTNEIQDVTKPHYNRFAKIFDITNCNGEILLSDDSYRMRRLKSDGKFEELSLSTHKDIEFCGIHATNVNEIIIGFKRDSHYGSSTGILQVDDVHSVNNTSKIRKIECGGCSKNSLFTMPKKITKHVCGNICVIDQIDSIHGRIVVIGKWGQPKRTYSGHPSINFEKDFFPNDIVTTSSSLILIAEKKLERLSQIEQELKSRKNTLHEVLEKKEPASVFSTVEKIKRDIPEKAYLKIQPPEFVYIEPKNKIMKEVLGSVIRVPKISLVHSFNVFFLEISGLLFLTDDICVMYSDNSGLFKYFTISGSKFVTTKTYKMRVENVIEICKRLQI
ncbi:unnamed protein product [Mytilus edulis]|uniref:Uncharacterized protein n=1 Tax=Mytilus edulis TaxID=6550 RepID=A0A8S3TH73_MYTED|nr:unnamed protein product [Mytilus edulis]